MPGSAASRRRVPFLAVLVLVTAGCVWTPSLTAGRYAVTVTSNIVYGQGVVNGGAGQVDLKLDLYTPQGTGRTELPLVVIVHGGGFVSGSKSDGPVVKWAQGFAGRGYVVASIDYRLQGTNPVPSPRVAPVRDALVAAGGGTPQQIAAVAAIDDTLTALDHLVARSDTVNTRVVLVGGSAGAITVDYVAYALDDFGVARPSIGAVVSNWGGFAFGSATDFVDAGEPPVFLAHATGDPTVAYSQSTALQSAATAVGVANRLFTKNANVHGFDLTTEQYAPGKSVLDAQIDFVTCRVYGALSSSATCKGT